jgi:hypothetical protein
MVFSIQASILGFLFLPEALGARRTGIESDARYIGFVTSRRAFQIGPGKWVFLIAPWPRAVQGAATWLPGKVSTPVRA